LAKQESEEEAEEPTMSGKTRREQLQELLELDPDDSFVRYGLAMEHVSAGQDEEAVRYLRELIGRDPDYVPAYLQAGRALMRLGEDREAQDVLRTGIAVATRKGDTHAAGEMTGFLESLS
jgi:Tfp pilus assembly protein PilF